MVQTKLLSDLYLAECFLWQIRFFPCKETNKSSLNALTNHLNRTFTIMSD